MEARNSAPQESVESVRRAAIDHHHDVASVFEHFYREMERSRFANAFTYGRYKVDVVLDRELAKLPKGSRVLDVGCGTGVYLRRFAAAGLDPVGVEPARAMLEVARRENPSMRIEQGVATELPFEDASVDALTSIEVLRYLHRADIHRSLREMFRVLRPGGFLFVTLVNRLALDGFYVHQRLRQRRKGVDFDRKNPHCEFHTPGEAEDELRRAGFVDARTEGRLLAPMRIAYKAHTGLASRLARHIERVDDTLHERFSWTKPFAGHLIAMANRPKVEGSKA